MHWSLRTHDKIAPVLSLMEKIEIEKEITWQF